MATAGQPRRGFWAGAATAGRRARADHLGRVFRIIRGAWRRCDWSVPATIYNDQQGETSAVSIAYADGRLWIANGQSVTELNASTGKRIRVLSGEAYHFTGEPAIAVAGTHVFVVNGDGNSVTEIDASTGALVHTLTAPRYHLDNPVGIAVVGNRAWILNSPLSGASSVVELALSAG